MVVPQRKFREIVFQMIFSQDLNREVDLKIISSLLDQLMVTKKVLRQAQERAQAVFQRLEEIDALISDFSVDYDFKRISRVERNVLRLGVFELLHDEAVPPKVAIAEAIRLSRKFGTPEGGAFVNGVMDSICQNQRVDEPDCSPAKK
jgi:N utilization substance protein B